MEYSIGQHNYTLPCWWPVCSGTWNCLQDRSLVKKSLWKDTKLTARGGVGFGELTKGVFGLSAFLTFLCRSYVYVFAVCDNDFEGTKYESE